MLTCAAVLPYFPYSRQSKKKSHRGAITARMLANLLSVAGINHVITIDLHASQMQGFFKCPVDNLHAEPIIARWIRHNVQGWREAVCVSKNAGGTKRVTSLADALKLNFGIVTTDRKRGGSMSPSTIMTQSPKANMMNRPDDFDKEYFLGEPKESQNGDTPTTPTQARQESQPSSHRASHTPRIRSHSSVGTSPAQRSPLIRSISIPTRSSPIQEESEYTDERAREVIHGRLVQGHIVPDDYPSPTQSPMSSSIILEQADEDPMEMSRASSFFAPENHALGGTQDAAPSSDEEEDCFKDSGPERMITLVGDVKNRKVFIIDDMIDKSGSWVAAAETVVKRGGAKEVYCIATHGLFGGDALQELQACDCINTIVVTNSFPIPEEKARGAHKLVILDLSHLLSEAIRRNHYGESISALFQHISD
jgi:ribose-phosphate pyrophosphokinase